MKNILRCENCAEARKAENEEYVGCALLLRMQKLDYDECWFDFYKREQINTGWVDLGAYPNDEKGSGMVTNGIPCFKKDDICDYWHDI